MSRLKKTSTFERHSNPPGSPFFKQGILPKRLKPLVVKEGRGEIYSANFRGKNSKQLVITVRRHGQARGFTLVEVVLALTIFALMGGILYGAFSLSQRAVEKSQAHAAQNQKQRSIADLLSSYVRSAYPYRESPQEQTAFFEGDSEALTFVSAYSQARGGRGMAKIQILKDEDENGRTVVRLQETTPVRLNGEGGTGGQTYGLALYDNVREFRLDYLDPQGEDENWEERWDARERRTLPRAVRLTYQDERGTEVRRVFPVMMVVLAP
jgi:prepilin-type N-terminal cleavage/methylation domain-containing protein